jgi:hypothetical protein
MLKPKRSENCREGGEMSGLFFDKKAEIELVVRIFGFSGAEPYNFIKALLPQGIP